MAARSQELGAMFVRLSRAMIAAERPVLRAHGLEMWDYVVLGGLERGAARTQSQLALAVGRDKTRLIPILDRLEELSLVARTPDPGDRRNRIVTLTEAGRALLIECRASIRRLEDEMLADFSSAEQRSFRAMLDRLAKSAAPEVR